MTDYIGRVTVSDTGAISTSMASVNLHGCYQFGGNETSRILMTGNSGLFWLLDTDTGISISVSGIPGNTNSEWNALPVFTIGDTYIVLHLTDDVTGRWTVTRLRRYAINPTTGVATPLTPMMVIPQYSSVDRPWDGYDDIYGAEVWDEGDYIAVGLSVQFDDPIYVYSYRIAIFDGTSTSPLHIITLAEGSQDDVYYQTGPNNITFAKTIDGQYQVSYQRMSKRPVPLSPQTTWWYTWVHRYINPATGALGSEIFVTDTEDRASEDFWRADGGTFIAQVWTTQYPNYGGSKLFAVNGSVEEPGEGGVTVVPWHGLNGGINGQVWPYAWFGLQQGANTPGLLYFKHRWP